MSQNSIAEYLQLQRERYLPRPVRQARGALLDECVTVSGLDRKHLIKVLGGRRPVKGDAPRAPYKRQGRPPACGDLARRRTALRQAPPHRPARLVAALGKSQRPLSAAHRALLRRISPAQLDRLLAPCRAAAGSRHPRRGGDRILKAQVPLRTGPWDISGPGWTEVDSVAHCGGSMSDGFR